MWQRTIPITSGSVGLRVVLKASSAILTRTNWGPRQPFPIAYASCARHGATRGTMLTGHHPLLYLHHLSIARGYVLGRGLESPALRQVSRRHRAASLSGQK